MPFDAARFDPAPSRGHSPEVSVAPELPGTADIGARAVLVTADTPPPAVLGLDREALQRHGFRGAHGETLVLPASTGPALVAVGVGDLHGLDARGLRDAAAAFARAVPWTTRLAVEVPGLSATTAEHAARAVVEGALLARYSFSLRSTPAPPVAVDRLVLVASQADLEETRRGARRGEITSAACALGRDLATCPGGILTATRMADLAVEIGAATGLGVEVFDEDALRELGCGGLLGVNQGSTEPPRMVRLTYRPEGATGSLTLVGKGIMYDSGGISLKPSDAVHATMKNDMSGAGSVLSAMSTLQSLECRTEVTGYLMCTDNMPSGTAMQMGDVLTVRGGTTVEVLNTDAEGRLVMADALVLATEHPTDAIVDIATLTGACLRALGPGVAGLLGNDDALLEQVTAAATATDEPVWNLPLVRGYRSSLDSDVADLNNLGAANAGAITAGLFLQEFVAGTPWAHIDIAGTAQADAPQAWRPKGPTGFGTRLLIDLATSFVPPVRRTVEAGA